MRRLLLLAAIGCALIALIAAAAVQAASTATTLNGTVGPGFTITLTKGGAKVTRLKHGKGWVDPRLSLFYDVTDTTTVSAGAGIYREPPQPMFGRYGSDGIVITQIGNHKV